MAKKPKDRPFIHHILPFSEGVIEHKGPGSEVIRWMLPRIYGSQPNQPTCCSEIEKNHYLASVCLNNIPHVVLQNREYLK